MNLWESKPYLVVFNGAALRFLLHDCLVEYTRHVNEEVTPQLHIMISLP